MRNNKIKSNWIGTRVTDDLKEQIEDYLDGNELTGAQIFRAALKEYMKKHPKQEEN